MERKVGEVFECDGIKIKAVKDIKGESCEGCFYNEEYDCGATSRIDILGFCASEDRQDGNDIIFKKVK